MRQGEDQGEVATHGIADKVCAFEAKRVHRGLDETNRVFAEWNVAVTEHFCQPAAGPVGRIDMEARTEPAQKRFPLGGHAVSAMEHQDGLALASLEHLHTQGRLCNLYES